jgi:hypothetical protein
MLTARDYADLPPPTVREALIAARVPELERGLDHDLAIASDQAMPKPTFRQRIAARLKSMVVAETPASSSYDTAGYYPVRRSH